MNDALNKLAVRSSFILHRSAFAKNEFIVFRDIDTDQVSVIYKPREN
jgi:hypothetical protein